jgi:hypothetical protein
MNYCNKQIENGHGKTFTYTLLKEEELVWIYIHLLNMLLYLQ